MGPLQQFSEMTMPEKLGALYRGLVLRGKYWDEGNDHGSYPEAALSRFKRVTRLPRVNRNVVDKALNFGGGYDFGARDVPLKDAVEMARAYQLLDYMTTFDPQRERDAQLDYEENVAGLVKAKADQELNRSYTPKQLDAMVLERAKQFAAGGLVQMKGYK